jgi:hypothetical protein
MEISWLSKALCKRSRTNTNESRDKHADELLAVAVAKMNKKDDGKDKKADPDEN